MADLILDAETIAVVRGHSLIDPDLRDTFGPILNSHEALRAALFDLCEGVSDFHTSYTCMDSDLVIPDMLAAMHHAQRRARAALEAPAEVRGE